MALQTLAVNTVVKNCKEVLSEKAEDASEHLMA